MQLSIEREGFAMLRKVVRGQVALLFRAIRRPTFARVVNPAHDIVIVRLFADTGKIRGKNAPHRAVTLADRMATETATRFEQFFPLCLVTLRLSWDLAVKAVLPQIGCDGL